MYNFESSNPVGAISNTNIAEMEQKQMPILLMVEFSIIIRISKIAAKRKNIPLC